MAFDAKKHEQLSAYLDGELPAAERAAVEALLARDAEARACMEQLRKVSRFVNALPRDRAPGGLAEAVVARMERASLLGDEANLRPAPRAVRWSRPLAMAASLLIVGTVAWFSIPSFRGMTGSTAVKTAEAPRPADHMAEGVSEERLAMSTGEESVESLRGRMEAKGARLRDQGVSQASRDDENKADDYAYAAKAPAPRAADEPAVTLGVNKERLEVVQPSYLDRKDADAGTDVTAPAEPVRVNAASAPPPAFGTLFDDADKAKSQTIDLRLAANNVQNIELQRAPIEAFGNHLQVEVDDPSIVEQLGRVIESNMTQVSATNLNSVPPDQAMSNSQNFWTSRGGVTESKQGEIGFDETDDEGPPWVEREAPAGERVYVVNVSRAQAAPLLASMKSLVDSNRTVAVWTANNIPVSQSRLADEAMVQFSAARADPDDASCENVTATATGSSRGAGGGGQPAESAVRETGSSPVIAGGRGMTRAATNENAKKSDKPETEIDGPRQTRQRADDAAQDPVDQSLEEDEDSADTSVRSKPESSVAAESRPGSSGRFQATSEPAMDDFITMAISLRANPLLRSLRAEPKESPGKSTPIAGESGSPARGFAPAAPTSQTSQPTTQGSPRG